jgi:hypothetical protein
MEEEREGESVKRINPFVQGNLKALKVRLSGGSIKRRNTLGDKVGKFEEQGRVRL